tara:strand:+ start:139 stop:318 length:180 start_codon:yes stop_codon:yes gene_type:complete
MKKVIVKFIGVKKYLVKDDADPQKIKDMFRKDLEVLPTVWANNIEAVMYAKDEPEAEEE